MVRKWKNFNLFELFNFFAFLIDNLCDNALDLTIGQLIVENNWPYGTYCQWLLSAQDDDDYVTLEFQNFNVRKIIVLKELKSYVSKFF